MSSLWVTLVPLVIGSAVVPIQVVVTTLLLRRGTAVTAAWIGGMTALRLVQGVVFGLVFTAPAADQAGDGGPGPVMSGILLGLAVLLYALAVRQLTGEDDPDAPPPRWMTVTEGMGTGRAFVTGAGVLAVGPKFWVFTLAAVGAIADADLARPAGIATFLVFVLLAESVHLVMLGAVLAVPEPSARALARIGDWLVEHNAGIVVVLGVVFGTWFLVQALDGLGVL